MLKVVPSGRCEWTERDSEGFFDGSSNNEILTTPAVKQATLLRNPPCPFPLHTSGAYRYNHTPSVYCVYLFTGNTFSVSWSPIRPGNTVDRRCLRASKAPPCEGDGRAVERNAYSRLLGTSRGELTTPRRLGHMSFIQCWDGTLESSSSEYTLEVQPKTML